MEEDYKDFKSKNEGKWEEIKTHLSGAALELENAVKVAFKKKNS